MPDARTRRLLSWTCSGLVAAAATGLAMYREVTTFGKNEPIQTGLDFSNNTWRAVRDLVAGQNIYAVPHEIIPGIGPAWPVSQHVPASLLWQAPVAALSLPAALFTFTFLSILAIWAAVFLLIQPAEPAAVFLTASCSAFAICIGGGPFTLLLGQPTGFILLGLAILVRARNPWLAATGLLLAASTLQTGIPLGLALLLLRAWPTVWRGIALIAACSIPPVSLEIANAGFSGFAGSFVTGAGVHLGRLSNRIDLGGLLGRLGLTNVSLQVAAGLLTAVLALAFLARLPSQFRRIDYPPVLCLVISFTLLCTYHQPYDVLLVGGAIVPVIFLIDRSRAMLPVFGLAGICATLSTYQPGLVVDPVGIAAIGVISALTAWHTARSAERASTDGVIPADVVLDHPPAGEASMPAGGALSPG